MDLEDLDNQAKKADGLLTTLGFIWDKHWKKLFVIAVLTPVIWFCSLVVDEVESPTPDDDYVGPDAQYQVDDYYMGLEGDTAAYYIDTLDEE